MEELKKMLCKELDAITEQRNLTPHNLDMIDKLTHSIKSIETIMAMEDSGYSRDNSYAVDRRGRNADGSYRMSHEGSYRMRNDGGRDQRYSYGYSRELRDDLEHLKKKVDGREKEMLDSFIKELEG